MPNPANWFHANVKPCSRGKGKTGVGLASYTTGERLKNEQTNRWCHRGHPGDVKAWGSTAPKDAPAWLTDPAQLGKAWNAVEASETRKNSHVANHWDIGLWRNGTVEEHKELMQELAQRISDRYGVLCTWAIHEPPGHGDERNWHGHIAHNMREVTPDGFGAKVRHVTATKTKGEEVEWVRQTIADLTNEFLEKKGEDERVSHLTYKAQGIEREPTRHLGNEQNQAELKGEKTRTGNKNRAAKKRNEERERERAASQAEQDAAMNAAISITYAMRETGELEPIQEEVLEQQARMEADRLTELQAQDERIQAWRREQDALAEDAKKKQKENEEAAALQAQTGDIASATTRYTIAVGKTYNIKDPYATLAEAAVAEGAAFKREQAELRGMAAKEQDAELRRMIDLRREIEANEYMALTSNRLAGISATISGREDAPQAVIDRERARSYQEQADTLRRERADMQKEREEGEKRKSAERGTERMGGGKEREGGPGEMSDAKQAKLDRMAATNAAYAAERQQSTGRERGGGRGR